MSSTGTGGQSALGCAGVAAVRGGVAQLHGLLVTLALLVALVGCDTQRSPDGGAVPVENGAVGQSEQVMRFTFPDIEPRPPVVDERDLAARHGDLSPGSACSSDEQCASPLRCLADRCAFPMAMTGQVEPGTPRVAFLREDGAVVFHLELAVTRAEQSRGLMHRRSIVEDYGMLFWYAEEQPLRFWMEQTLIPLDMIFVSEELEVVHVEHEAEPLTREPRGPRAPSRYVVEVKGGLARSHGIRPGDHVVFDGVERAVGGLR